MVSDSPRCRSCRFYVEIKRDSPEEHIGPYGETLDLKGVCHRYPPQIDSEGESCWPIVHELGWCGEHQSGTPPSS